MNQSYNFVAYVAAKESKKGLAYHADLDSVSNYAADDASMREFSVKELARFSGIASS